MEDGTFIFQLAAQLDGVGQVAVVAQCHGAAAVPDDHGLCIGPHTAACRGVAHVTGSHVRIGFARLASTAGVNTSFTRPRSRWPLITPSSFTAMPQLS